jgi:hypothetical protein
MKQRTTQQNKALHKYYELIARTLNEHGLDMRKALKPEIDIMWTKDSVKEYLWRPIQEAQVNKTSTTELTTHEIDLIVHTITKFFGEHHKLYIPFPSIEQMMEMVKKEKIWEKKNINSI